MLPVTLRRRLSLLLPAVILLAGACACGEDDRAPRPAPVPAREAVRAALAAFRPAAGFGHRGAGINITGRTLPENSIPAFLGGLALGADAVELDTVVTADGRLVVLHDNTLERTTTCSGCASGRPLQAIRACRLLNGNVEVTEARPPTLAEVFAALPPGVLVSVELKVYRDPCRTEATGPAALVAAGIREVEALGVAHRVLWSSFDPEVVAALKAARPDYYIGLLFSADAAANVETAARLGLDAVFPEYGVLGAVVPAARARGLQVIVWTVNGRGRMLRSLDLGVDGIISDEVALLREVLAERRREPRPAAGG